MFDQFLAHILIVILLLVSAGRVFFIKEPRLDSSAILPFIALIISGACVFCFNFSIITGCLIIISLYAFFCNLRAFFRVTSGLVVDQYSVPFIIASIIEIILVATAAVFLVYFRPVRYYPETYNVRRTSTALTGNFSNIRVRQKYAYNERFTGSLFVYEPMENQENEKPVVVFSGNIRGTVKNYEPFLILLAQKGYKIAAADFYTKEMDFFGDLRDSKYFRRISVFHEELSKSEKFTEITKKDKELAAEKYRALSVLTRELFGDDKKIFYVVDGINFETISAVMQDFDDTAIGFYPLNRIEEYTTSEYGFIEQTDLITAKRLNVERDSSLFIPRYAAVKTDKHIEQILESLKPAEATDDAN